MHINWSCKLKYSGVKCMSPNACNLLSKSSVKKKIHIPPISGWWVKRCVLYSSFNFLYVLKILLKEKMGEDVNVPVNLLAGNLLTWLPERTYR